VTSAGMSSISQSWWIVFAFVAAAAFVVALMGPARRVGLIDHPVGRKAHKVPTLVVGGLAIFLSMLLTMFLAGLLMDQSASLMIAMVIVVGIGVADDAHEIGYRSKFFAQLVAGLLIVSGTSIHVMHLGDIFGFGDFPLGKWSYLITVIAIIGLMNAINMIDGLDGLAGTQALVPVTFFALVALSAGDARMGLELLILGGAIAGFLVFNLRSPWRKRALVFLGDTGSLLLGLLLAWYSIRLAGAESAPLRPMTAVWILAVPLLDMGSSMFRRMVQKKSPFHPDRQHLHYIFRDAGFSVNQVVFLMGALAVACSVLALAGEAHGVPDFVMFGAFIGLLLVYGKLLTCPKVVARLAKKRTPALTVPESRL
jgi:UDP-GlcNAc:undecaprenyl-phosphate/decaprenyl-phosphate GlcNAc-1-phosphate transferase